MSSAESARVSRDSRGYLYVDGVRIARCVQGATGPCLEFIDKDRRRSERRGSDRITVGLDELGKVTTGGDAE